MPDPTRRQVEVLQAYVDLGGAKRAAPSLGIATATVVRTIELTRARVGVETTAQLVVELAVRGLIRTRDDVR